MKPVARESTEKPVALFSNKRKSRFLFEHPQILGNNESLFRFSNWENWMKSNLEEHKDYVLAEAKSEVRKQESRKAEEIFSTVLFAILRDNLIPTVRKPVVPVNAMKILEKSKPDFMKSLLSEKSMSRNSNQKYS